MPRFFFNVRDGVDLPDEEGMELPGPDRARSQAIVTAGEMMRDKGRELWPGTEWSMQVTDERGDTVCILKFSARC
jgi:hypothetical protein